MNEIVVDQFGKVEIPVHLRARLGWLPGRRLLVEADEEGFLKLSPVTEEASALCSSDFEPRLIEEDGLLALEAGNDLDIDKLIDELREERMQKLMEGIPV
jgi:bifunctional DNA-binding transcriptional regulator/antitoxin component of YhaV-PrlF toxin-antitoxin module